MTKTKARIALGLMTFGPTGTEGTRIDLLLAFTEILSTFHKAGYDELDTARTYNDSQQENWTSRAIMKSDTCLKFTIATKWWPYTPGDHAPLKIRTAIEASLSALNVECLDIWYLHAPDWATPFEITLQAVDELYREGKIKKLGLSNYAAWEVAEIVTTCKLKGWIMPSIYQAMYNCLTRSIEEELVPCCRKYGLDIMVYNVLAGGVLSGRYKSKEAPDDGGRYSGSSPGYTEAYKARFWKDTNFEALKLIQPMTEKYALTLVEVAYRWALWHSELKIRGISAGNDGILIGASSLQQLQSNLESLDGGRLPQEVLDTLDIAWKITKADCASYRLKEFYDKA